MSSLSFGDKVKVGITFDPLSRIRNMQTCNPEPIKYVCIYTLSYSNDISLSQLEENIHTKFNMFKYSSSNFGINDRKPTEFFLFDIISEIDNYMAELKNIGQIDYIKFCHQIDYLNAIDNIYDPDLIQILKGYDSNYIPNK